VKRHLIILLLTMLTLLAACRDKNTAVSTPTPATPAGETVGDNAAAAQPAAPSATPSPVPSATPQPTATPIPPKALTVCMTRPQSLYLYGDSSLAAVAIRHAIYENLTTSLGYDYQAQGLEKLPTSADGDLTVQPVTVHLGDPVVDFRGDAHVLREGLTVYDSSGQLVTVSNQPVEMQQVTAVFTLKPLVWSDGVPVSAADSVFSFNLAANPDTPGDKRKVQRTAVYEATGPLTLRWTGLPGYLPGDVVDRLDIRRSNEALLAEGKQPARYVNILLGITKASLTTDSFLSASSFQHTIKVLAKAAIGSDVDPLYGLKENVIIGKLIPAGSGFVPGRFSAEKENEGLAMRSAHEDIDDSDGLDELDTDLADDVDGVDAYYEEYNEDDDFEEDDLDVAIED